MALPAEEADQLRDELEMRFDEAADDGFEGVALVIVDGETVFERAYGLADRQRAAANIWRQHSYRGSRAAMTQPAVKLSVSVPFELAKAVRKRVGERGVSSFVARAMKHELERAQLGAYLEELDAELGPVAKKAMTAARRAWRRR